MERKMSIIVMVDARVFFVVGWCQLDGVNKFSAGSCSRTDLRGTADRLFMTTELVVEVVADGPWAGGHTATTRLGVVKVTIEREGIPANGDKFSTLHGQKGVITIVPDNRMPIIGAERTEIIIGSVSIVKRGTPSQLLEGALSKYVSDSHSSVQHPMTCSDAIDKFSTEVSTSDRESAWERAMNHYCTNLSFGKGAVQQRVHMHRSNTIKVESVRCNYGIIRATICVHCIHKTFLYQYMLHFQYTQFLWCLVDVCSKCNQVCMLCSCSENPERYKMRLRHSSLKYMIGLCVIGNRKVEITGCK
jgi:hypothetical protein